MGARIVRLVTLLIISITLANAIPVTYKLSGVTFNDGGTASGNFTFDPATGLFSSVNIVTTSGGVRTGATYQFVCGQDVPSCVAVTPGATSVAFLTSTNADQTGAPILALFLPQPLGSAAVMAPNPGLETSCLDATCTTPTPPSRTVTAGVVAALISQYLDAPYQVRYAANLNIGESYIDILNTGLNGAPLYGPGFAGFLNSSGIGNICVNLYALATDEQLDACCSCLVTPDEVVSLGVKSSLLANNLTPLFGGPTAETIKLIGTRPGAGATPSNCANSAALLTSSMIVGGFSAWGTTLHATPKPNSYATTETAFLPATFLTNGAANSEDELHSLTGRCAAILGNGSGLGVCNGCRMGALGAAKQ